MDKPKTTDRRPTTLVERLDRIVDGYYSDSEDYKVVKYALRQVDYMNRPKVSGMKVQGESEVMCGTDLDDDYSDLREPMQ